MVASPVQGHLSPRLDGAGPTKSPGLYPRSRTFRGVRCSSNGWLENPVYLPVAESYMLLSSDCVPLNEKRICHPV